MHFHILSVDNSMYQISYKTQYCLKAQINLWINNYYFLYNHNKLLVDKVCIKHLYKTQYCLKAQINLWNKNYYFFGQSYSVGRQ